MDQRLLSWGRAVKQRNRSNLPTLWLFTESPRNPLPSIARLPRFVSGVVFRHDSTPNRAALAAQAAKLCKSRHISMVIAGDARLASRLKTGFHLRAGRWPNFLRPRGLITASAHTPAEARRARRAGAAIIFVSPAFRTASHPNAPGLGPARWRNLARHADPCAYALGGITGANIRRLSAQGAAAITALTASPRHSRESGNLLTSFLKTDD
jgi:thiamine-phosphate pyrophosphorylase